MIDQKNIHIGMPAKRYGKINSKPILGRICNFINTNETSVSFITPSGTTSCIEISSLEECSPEDIKKLEKFEELALILGQKLYNGTLETTYPIKEFLENMINSTNSRVFTKDMIEEVCLHSIWAKIKLQNAHATLYPTICDLKRGLCNGDGTTFADLDENLCVTALFEIDGYLIAEVQREDDLKHGLLGERWFVDTQDLEIA